MDIESCAEIYLKGSKHDLLRGGFSPKVILRGAVKGIIIDPFDFSDRNMASRSIQATMKKCRANLVVLIYDASREDPMDDSDPTDEIERRALCITVEVKEGSLAMLQEYEIDRNGVITFTELHIFRSPPKELLTGFFKG
jgi:hypothetical protein